MKLLYAHWMQELDAKTINGIGIPSIVLMENASKGAADFFEEFFPRPQYTHIIVLVGKGNNGGDGLAAGRILYQKGYTVEFVMLSKPEKLNPDPLINYKVVKQLDLPVTLVEDESHLHKLSSILSSRNPANTFIIDALFGTGLSKPVKPGLFSKTIETVAQSQFKVACIDIPSGLSDAFPLEDAVFIPADVTATFQSLKTAHLHPDGNDCCGTIRIIDIGIPNHLAADEKYYIHLIEPGDFAGLLQPRKVDGHKGSYGHTLALCGSKEKPGAGILSSYAVLKSGAGLCTTAVTAENRAIVVTAHPELMTLVYNHQNDIETRCLQPDSGFNAILMGPGLGESKETPQMVAMVLEKSPVPLVLDADALNVLKQDGKNGNKIPLLRRINSQPLIITPHPGEFSRLTGLSRAEIKQDRIGVSLKFALQYNLYVVLKGHHTVIAGPDGRVWVNQTGNPGMATAGSGDVLGGMIAGMLSQFAKTVPIDTILSAAVFLHGYAGDLAIEKTGEISLTAGDIIRYIPQAIKRINDFQSKFQFAN